MDLEVGCRLLLQLSLKPGGRRLFDGLGNSEIGNLIAVIDDRSQLASPKDRAHAALFSQVWCSHYVFLCTNICEDIKDSSRLVVSHRAIKSVPKV